MGLDRFYSSQSSTALVEKLSSLSIMSPGERYGLSEEVDMLRLFACDAVGVYDTVVVQGERPDGKSGQPTMQQRMAATELAKRAIQDVISGVNNAVRAAKDFTDVVEADRFRWFAGQVGRLIDHYMLDQLGAHDEHRRLMTELKSIEVPETTREATDKARAQVLLDELKRDLSELDTLVPLTQDDEDGPLDGVTTQGGHGNGHGHGHGNGHGRTGTDTGTGVAGDTEHRTLWGEVWRSMRHGSLSWGE